MRTRGRGGPAATTIRGMSNQADPAGAPGPAPFPRLFSPLRLGPLEIRNRIFSSGHDTIEGLKMASAI
jgi:hypothetical protein